MIRQNGSVDVAALLLIERPCPCLVVIGAHNDCQGRTVDACCLADFCKALLTLNDKQMNRLEVRRSRSHMSGFQNLLQLFRLNFLVSVTAYRVTFFCDIDKIHSMKSFL